MAKKAAAPAPLAGPLQDPVPFLPTASPVSTGKSVRVIGQAGDIGTVDAAEFEAAQAGGYRELTPEDEHRLQLQEKYGGLAGMAGAAGLGAARGATVGLSDVLGNAIGGKGYRDYANAVREANPTTDTVSEFAGMVAPALIPGEGVVAGSIRALGAPARAVGAAGSLAERGAAGLLGATSERVLGRVAQRATGMAAQGAVEAGLIGAGKQLSEDILGDHTVTAEKLIGAAYRDAKMGMGIGAILGGGSALLEKGVGSLARRALSVDADAMANDKAVKALGLKMGDARRLAKDAYELENETQRIGKVLRDEGVLGMENKTKAEIAKAVDDKLEQSAGRLGKLRSEAGKVGPNGEQHLFDLNPVVDEIMEKVVNPLAEGMSVQEQNVAKEVYRYLENLSIKGHRGTLTFEETHTIRRKLDEIIYANNKDPSRTMAGTAFNKVRGILENGFETQAEKATAMMNPTWLESYKAEKAIYSALSDAKKIVVKEAAREFAAPAVGLRDYLGGGFGGRAGAIAGWAVGGPVGASIGSVVGGAAGAAVNNFVRNRGDQLLANVLDKAARLQAVQGATTEFTRKLEKGVHDFVQASSLPAQKAASQQRYSEKDYSKVIHHIRQMASSPDLVTAEVHKAVGPAVVQAAPKAVTQIVLQQQQRYAAAAARIPTVPTTGNYLQPLTTVNRRPNTIQIQKFFKFMEGMTDLTKVMHDARKGRLSRETVEGAKAGYPQLFAQLQDMLRSEVGKKKGSLSNQQLSALSIIWDTPLAPNQEPKSIAENQAAFEPGYADDGSQEQAAVTPKRPIDVGDGTETAVEEIMA